MMSTKPSSYKTATDINSGTVICLWLFLFYLKKGDNNEDTKGNTKAI